jgi:hypothetical protein
MLSVTTKFYMKHPHWHRIYTVHKYSVTTNSLLNSFIYMATSFDPKLGSSADHNIELETYTDLPVLYNVFLVKGGDFQRML